MLRGGTGTPIRRDGLREQEIGACRSEPLTLANRMTESFTARSALYPACAISSVNFIMLAPVGSVGAEPAMQAEILVLDHHPPGLHRLRDIDRQRQIERGRDERPPEFMLRGVGYE